MGGRLGSVRDGSGVGDVERRAAWRRRVTKKRSRERKENSEPLFLCN
jgi:hypothetical protein